MAEIATTRIVPLTDIPNLESVVIDFNTLLSGPTNADIQLDFPAAYMVYRGDLLRAKERLENIRQECVLGKKEQFVMFSGSRAVGMSTATSHSGAPDTINPEWPNVSILICKPYRGQGIGKLTMERLLESVNENFDGHAWAEVRVDNIPSHNLVTGAGFVDTYASLDPTRRLYLYGG